MLDANTLNQLSNQLGTSTYVVLREYCQAVTLSAMARHKHAAHFVFKGGTCIRFLYGGDRFSEDLDFTIQNLDPDQAATTLTNMVNTIRDAGTITLKPKKSLAGKTFMLTWSTPIHKANITIKIDLSFRETDFQVEKSALTFLRYPIKSDSLIYHYSTQTILAEKVHAIMNRTKGRDLYDIWFLIAMLTPLNIDLISKKMAFFGETFNKTLLIDRLQSFPADKFVADLSPFVTNKDRPRLAEIHSIITATLPQRFKSVT
jgi:predicted nucleotidyltransferase component of viral defense system